MATTAYSFDAAAARLGLGRNRLIARLRELELIDENNLPRGQERRSPNFRVRQGMYNHPIKGWTHYARTEITQQGLRYIERRLAGEHPPAPRKRKAARSGRQQEEIMRTKNKRTEPAGPQADIPEALMHDAGELVVVTLDGERTHHRHALVLAFETPEELQRAIDRHRCAYRIRRDLPEERLYPALTQRA